MKKVQKMLLGISKFNPYTIKIKSSIKVTF